MSISSFGYVSDNGQTYQLAWEASNEAALAGALPPAVAANPIFPALWTPRRMVARALISGQFDYRHIICLAANAAYVSGPGSTVVISGTTYTVRECLGEITPIVT